MCGVSIGLLVSAIAGSASAAAAAAAPKDDTELTEVVVTGSSIRGAPPVGSNLVSVGQADIQKTGAQTVQQVLRSVPSVVGMQAVGQGAFGSADGAGTNAPTIHGLGASASNSTLILIDGHRFPLSGINHALADPNILAPLALERVEVLADGASSVYGSDAVAGVINIITRTHFDGARVEIDGQTSTRFDQKDGTLSGAWGATSKRGRVFISASYFRRSELRADQRDWTKDGYVSSAGYPGSFIVGTNTVVDPACSSVPGSAVTQGTSGPICSFQYRRFASLSPEAERANAFGSGEFDVTKHLTFFGEVLASRLRGGYVSSPAFPVPPPFLNVPANHVDNPFGQNVLAIIRPVGAAAGPTHAETDDDTLRGVVGLKGDFEGAAADTFLEAWEWEAYMSLAADRSRFLLPDTLRGPLQDALNSCSNPADLAGCYNPFYSAVNGTGTPNSTAVINSVYGAQNSLTDSLMQTYNAGLTGPLFALPGGDLAVALGGEVRHESRSTSLDHDANQNRYSFLIGNTNSKADREVFGGYLELGWPIFHGIRLQTAGRIEYYTDIARSAFSPSAGLTVTPSEMVGRKNTAGVVQQLQFRGTVTSAFRAPNLYQSFPGYVVQPSALNVGQPLPQYLPVQGFGNPNLKPEHALAVSGGFSWAPIDELSFSGDFWYYDYQDRIELENAQQIVNQFLASGMDPRVIVDPTTNQIERVTTKYVNIAGHVITDGIDFSTYLTLTNKTFGGEGPVEKSHKLTLGAIGTYLLTFDYPLSEAAPRQIPGTNPPVVLAPAPCGATSCSAAGIRNFNNVWQAMPRLKMNFPLTWSYLGHSASFITHFISGYKDDVNPNPDGSFDSISPWVTFDIQYGYTLKNFIGKELTARIGLYNLFDADPPKVNGLTTSYDYTLHDPRGRMLFAKLSVQF
jgi:iron complex outermembrane receptor protein